MDVTLIDATIRALVSESIYRRPLHGPDVMTEEPDDHEGNAVPATPSTGAEGRDLESMIVLMIPVLKEHGVTKAGVYGSRVTGDAREESDLDVIVELPEKASLLDLVRLQGDLEDLLGIKVDLVEYGGLHPRLRDGILSEERRIL
jgi:predicted nucleotidyltransferase